MRTLPEPVLMLPELCQAVLQTGVGVFLQSTLLLVAGIWGGAALRRASPTLACLLYRTTLLGILLCALLSAALSGRVQPIWSFSLPQAQEQAMMWGEGTAAAAREVPAAAVPAEPSGAAMPPARPLVDARGRPVTVRMDAVDSRPTRTDGAAWPLERFRDFLRPGPPGDRPSRAGWFYVGITGVWMAGALGMLAWLLLCYRGIGQLCRTSAPVAEPELQALLRELCAARGVRTPLLLASREVQSVFLAGLWRPAILLPTTYATDFDREAMRAILAHEVAHLARRDPAWTLFARLLCAVAWVQPLLWLLCRRWDELREELCDLAVLQHRGVSPRAYADCLLRLAERLTPSGPQRIAGTGIVLFRSSLGRRVERLLTASSRPALSSPAPLRSAVALGMALAKLSAPFLVSAAAAPGEEAMANDARLQRRVTITAEGIPLGELLPLLARKSGVSLAVDPDLADEKVIILGPARSMAAVMADLAALYHAFWLRRKSGDGPSRYTLVRDQQARRYEERLSSANDLRLLAQLEAQVKALGESAEQLARRPENDPIRQILSTPAGRTATQIYALLRPAQRQQLLERWHVRLPVSALSETLKDQIGDLFHGPRVAPDEHGIGPTPIPREAMDRHELTFSIWGARGAYRHTGNLRVTVAAPTGLDLTVTQFHASAKFLFPPHGNPYTGEKIQGGDWLPEPKLVPAAASDAWPDRLRRLAEKSGLPLMSDYYRSKPIHVAAAGEDEPAAPPGGPEGALDAFCRPEGYLWWTRGKTLLFRKRDWYHQRLYEVPDRWVLALARHLKAQKGVPTVANAVSLLELSTHQMVGLSESLGMNSDRRLLAGLREMLAVIAAAPGNKNAPVHSGVVVAGSSGSLAVRPDLRDPRQRALLQRFVEAYNRSLSPQEAFSEEFGFLLHSPDPRFSPPGVEYRSLYAHLYVGGGTLRVGYRMALPLSLPDDRREKTRIDVGS